MADRDMSAAMLAEIAKDSVRMVHLIKIGLSTPEYLTTAHKDISFNGDSYFAIGHILKIGTVTESLAMRVNSINLTLSGADQSFIATFLSQNITNKTLQIWLGFLDSGGSLIPDPLEIFSGRIDSFKVSEDTISGSTQISATAANHWVDWEKVAGRRSNDHDQQLYYPGDLGLEFASQIVKDLKWGKND